MYHFLSLIINIFDVEMKKLLVILAFICPLMVVSQTDYSDKWEDFYSYNNVKDIVVEGNKVFALVDNAVFVYDVTTKTTQKISSINGLSGETATAIHYNKLNERLVIGYETGLIEVIDKDGKITTSPEIVNFNQTGEKKINNIFEFQNKLYLSTSFAIVVYDINKLEFGDTYFIGAASSDVLVNDITEYQNKLYAATENGIYVADATNPNLVDFNNWNLQFVGNYNNIEKFNNSLFTSRGRDLIQINGNTSSTIRSFSQNIINLKESLTSLAVSLPKEAVFMNTSSVFVNTTTPTTEFDFTLNQAFEENGIVYLATQRYGILKTQVVSLQVFEEIHPEGPLFNDAFAIDAHNNHLWIVFGGYDATYSPLSVRKGYSHFNGINWINTKYNSNFPLQNLVHVTIDKEKENKVYLSAMGATTNPDDVIAAGGLLEIENEQVLNFYHYKNSELEKIPVNHPTYTTVRISGSTFDSEGNLWVTNIGVAHRLKKLTQNGQWSSFDLSSVYKLNKFGMNEIVIDGAKTNWIGTRGNGVYIVNERGNRVKSLTTETTKGSLPNLNVRTVAADKNNRIWLGTLTGLVVFNNALGVFDSEINDAEPIIILDDGVPQKLLGDQTINSIEIDGADNKWFGTENSGVLYTNPSGQKTLAKFDKSNSPLPSNKILKIRVDDITGKVFFATGKGIVAYNSKVSPFGEELGEVYAYPNPVLKNHDEVTIDGRNGTHLPNGTNVKIVDVAGNLVYETNVVEGQQLQGGKVVWNKRNLAGNKVASGIYVVLLTTEDGSESSSTKIAVVN